MNTKYLKKNWKVKMKKYILLLLFLIISCPIFAQTASGYFNHRTVAEVPAFNQKGYEYGYTTAVKAGGAAYYIYSMPLGWSSTSPVNSFMGKKVLLGINITTAFLDVNSTVIVEISGDGTNWVTHSTLDADSTPDVTGVQWYLADFTSTYAPYVRLKFNAGGLTIGTSGYVSFLYSIPQ
jgi:hypothetical protein